MDGLQECSSSGDEQQQEWPLTPGLIGNINKTIPGILKSSHLTLLKRLAKLAPNVDLHVRIRNGHVCTIGHTIDDYTSLAEE